MAYDTYVEERPPRARRDGGTVDRPAGCASQRAFRDIVWQLVACGNGALLDLYALWTDEFIALSGVTASDLDPRNEDYQDFGGIRLIDIVSVRLLIDGHVTAVVAFDGRTLSSPSRRSLSTSRRLTDADRWTALPSD